MLCRTKDENLSPILAGFRVVVPSHLGAEAFGGNEQLHFGRFVAVPDEQTGGRA